MTVHGRRAKSERHSGDYRTPEEGSPIRPPVGIVALSSAAPYEGKGRTALRARQFEDHVLDTLGRLPIGKEVVVELERQLIDERLNLLGSVAVDASASIGARRQVARCDQTDGEVLLTDVLATFPP